MVIEYRIRVTRWDNSIRRGEGFRFSLQIFWSPINDEICVHSFTLVDAFRQQILIVDRTLEFMIQMELAHKTGWHVVTKENKKAT